MEIEERMRAVLRAEADAIRAIEVNEPFVQAVLLMKDCDGKILTTGIGKAGYIASKFAATLCSTATPAVFVHPAEAAHGDLGLVDRHDVLSQRAAKVGKFWKFSSWHAISGCRKS